MKNYGSISQRSNGLFMGRVTYQGIQKTFYDRKRDIVQEKMNNFVMEIKYNKVCQSSTVSFGTFVNDYLMTFKYGFIKESSFDRLESINKRYILKSAIDIDLWKLDDVYIQKYLNSLIYVCSDSTLKKVYNLIFVTLKYAYKKKLIDVDYSSLLMCPKSRKITKSIETYTDSEIETLKVEIICNFCNYESYNQYRLFRYSLSYLIILETGLRAGELLALTWDNVDLENGVIHVVQSLSHVKNRTGSGNAYVDVIDVPKTKKSIRDIPMNNFVLKCFTLLKSDQNGCYVVHNMDGQNMKLRSYQQTFDRICKYIGVKPKGLHALRHTFASQLIKKGVSPKLVSDLLGHSSVVFTLNRYVHSMDDDLKQAVLLLDE